MIYQIPKSTDIRSFQYIKIMPIQLCPTHQLPQNVICGEAPCLQRFCAECFLQHNQQHNFGVTLNDKSKQSLIQWNEFLLAKFREIENNIKSKGISAIFQMKLVPTYPKGLLAELSNYQISEVGVKIIQDYLNTLTTNIEFISSRTTIDELDIPELMKDIYGFFVYEASRTLGFLTERVQGVLKERFPDKKMYDFVNFSFVPKEFRLIEVQRKKLVKNVENEVIIQVKKDVKLNSPVLSRSKISQKSSPFVRTAYSPRKQLLRRANEESGSVSSGLTDSRQNQFQKVQSPQRVQVQVEAKVEQKQPQLQNVLEKQEQISIKFQKEPEFSVEKQESLTKLQDVKEAAITFEKTEPIACSTPSQVSVVQEIVPEIKSELIEQENNNNQQILDLTKKNQELNNKIEILEGKVNQKQRSICELNKLINNEEEELLYRENEVEILTEEIRKLMNFKEKYEQVSAQLEKTKTELKFKERSIAQLNKLIGNEEQQIQSRENEVETLTAQIRKLVQWKERCQQIQSRLNEKQKQLDLREKGIKELNNVIGNEQQELAFRESEVEVLTSQLKKAQSIKLEADKSINELLQRTEFLETQNDQLINVVKGLQGELFKLSNKKEQDQTFDEQLMEEVIELESQIVSRNQDIKTLSEVINKFQKFIPQQLRGETIKALKNLKAVKFEV